MNSMQVLDTALAEMKSKLSLIPNLTSRFLTIGFSQNHDAVFLNKITKSGSELGNFFFIDTSRNDYTEEVKKCLSESLDIAIEGGNNAIKIEFKNDLFQHKEAHKVEVNFVYEEESKDGTLPVKAVTLTVQTIMKTAVLDGDVSIELLAQVNKETKNLALTVEKTLVEDPDNEIVIKARLQCANKQIFDLIQNVQKDNSKQRSQGYETLKILDRDVDLYMEDVQKIKNRDSKRELMEQVLDCKKKIAKVMEIIRACLNTQMTNLQIA